MIWGDGTRYRVVDVWHSCDHHGQFKDGPHVFLDRVDPGSDSDRPGRQRPDYFGVERPIARAARQAAQEIADEYRG